MGLHLPRHAEGMIHAWQHVFPSNKKLLQLASLSLCHCEPRMTLAHLQACVSCCPNLQELNIAHAVAYNMLPSALPQLPGLTNLTTHVSDADISVLMTLTGLQELTCEQQLGQGSSITQTGLLQLTALRRLTCLRFDRLSERFSALFGSSLQEQEALLDKGFVNKVRWRPTINVTLNSPFFRDMHARTSRHRLTAQLSTTNPVKWPISRGTFCERLGRCQAFWACSAACHACGPGRPGWLTFRAQCRGNLTDHMDVAKPASQWQVAVVTGGRHQLPLAGLQAAAATVTWHAWAANLSSST